MIRLFPLYLQPPPPSDRRTLTDGAPPPPFPPLSYLTSVLVVKVPDHDVAVAAAGEADLVVGGDGQSVAGGGGGRQLRLDAGGGCGQIPDGQRAGLPAHDQGSAVGQQLAGADVVVPVLIGHKKRKNINLYTH